LDYLDHILRSDLKAQTKHFKKGTILQQQGAISTKSFYVKKGLLRSYIVDGKGKEHIFNFASENWIVADVESQEFQNPIELYIDCLEDSEVVIFDSSGFGKTERSSEMMRDEIKLLARRTGVMQRRVLMLMSTPASERYTYFLDTYPDLSGRIPQHMIASYLGITPQALSTIRGRLARSN